MYSFKTNSLKFILVILWLIIMLQNCGGPLESDDIPSPENPPTKLLAKVNLDSSFITFSWDNVKDAESYNIYWGKKSGITTKSSKLENIQSPFKHKSNFIKGQIYYYRINAENSGGTSKLSDELSVLFDEKLQTPTGITTIADDQKVTISWNNIPGVTTYVIYWGNNPNVTVNSDKITTIANPYDHTNLKNGLTYYYRIRAVNEKDSSDLSVEVMATPNSTPPIPPENVRGVAGDGFAQIVWDEIPNVTYNIYWNTQPNVTKNSNRIVNAKSPYTHPNLTNNTTYYYRVSTKNVNNVESDLSNEINITPKEGILPPPTKILATSGNMKVNLNWNAVGNATSYSIYWDTVPNVVKTSPNIPNITSLQHVHESLTNGKTYYYRISAKNESVESELSEEVNATPTNTSLLPPENFQAKAGNEKITVTWTNVTNATSYNIYWDTKPNVTNLSSKLADVTTPYIHDSLTNGMTYYYRVSAVYATEESELSVEIKATPTDGTVPPPENIQARAGNEKITVSWNIVSNTIYNIYWANQANVTKNNSTKIQGVTSPYEHLYLTNGSNYYYRVSAVLGDVESELSNEVNAIPSNSTPPEPPINVKAIPGNKRIDISWDTSVSATSYIIYWANQPNITVTNSNKIDNVSNPFNHLSLTNGTPYYYRISAVNSIGEGQLSEEVTATPKNITTPPEPPENIETTPGNKLVEIVWDDVETAISYNLYWSDQPEITVSNSTKLADVSSPYVHQNLTNGKKYYYKLSAINIIGEGDLSEEFEAIPTTGNPPPSKPTDVTANAGNKMITINWNSVNNASFYNIYWATDTNVSINSTKISNVSKKYGHQNLTNGTIYYYRVSAENDEGESELSDMVYARPYDSNVAPLPPMNIRAKGGINGNSGYVEIYWDKVPNVEYYTIYWGTDDTTPIKLDKQLSINMYTQMKLKKNTTYYYRISGTNNKGEGAKSKVVQTITNE